MTHPSQSIQAVLDYIDDHVEQILDSDRLADHCRFSKSHFFKLFMIYTGFTPMHYVLRRKLHYASKRVLSGSERIVDIACRYGFESHDTFSRAFKRIYGISPDTCRRRQYTLREMKKPVIGHSEGGIEVDVHITERPAIHLVGVEKPIGSEDGEMSFGQVWECYFNNWQQLFGGITNRVRPEDDADYAYGRFDENGKLHYFVGFEVEAHAELPSGAAGVTIPAHLSAKATHVGPPATTLGSTLDYLYGDWILNSTYRTGHKRELPYSVIEYYDKRCGLNPPEMDIYIPLSPPTGNRIEDVAPFITACYRAEGSDGDRLKYEAFDRMIRFVEQLRQGTAGGYELGVRYGDTDEHEMYCEVFYKLAENERGCIDRVGDIRIRSVDGGTYAVSPGVHHFLEKDWQTFMNWLEQHDTYKPAGECYEQFRIEDGKLHFYTEVEFYKKVEPR